MSKKENRLKIFSALEVANMCGVVNQTAINWIKHGYLKAFTTPGGQYRVYSENLVDFLQSRGMKIPETLLPYVKEKKARKIVFIAETDRESLETIKEKILSGCGECAVITASSPFEAGASIVKENPSFIIISDSMSDITPAGVRETMAGTQTGKNNSLKSKIIYLRGINRPEEAGSSADLVLVKPPDYQRMVSFINSNSGA